MKKVISLIIILILLILCGLWSPWLYIKIDFESLIGLQKPEDIAGIEVYSLSGELEIYIKEELLGTATPQSSPFVFDRVLPGQNLIRIKRIAPNNFRYWEFSKVINFEEGKSVVISMNVGPSIESSEGQIITASKKIDPNNINQVTITTDEPNFNLTVDGAAAFPIQGNTFSTSFNIDSQKRFRITKLGYEPIEFTLLPNTQDDRDKLKDYDLNVEVLLMQQFVNVEEI